MRAQKHAVGCRHAGWNKRLSEVIQVEPIQARDNFFHAMSRPLGLEKGQPFRPDARQIKILTDAALVGEAMAKAKPIADSRMGSIDPTRTGTTLYSSTPTTQTITRRASVRSALLSSILA
jgi:hypothetical protein